MLGLPHRLLNRCTGACRSLADNGLNLSMSSSSACFSENGTHVLNEEVRPFQRSDAKDGNSVI